MPSSPSQDMVTTRLPSLGRQTIIPYMQRGVLMLTAMVTNNSFGRSMSRRTTISSSVSVSLARSPRITFMDLMSYDVSGERTARSDCRRYSWSVGAAMQSMRLVWAINLSGWTARRVCSGLRNCRSYRNMPTSSSTFPTLTKRECAWE